jgi:hypothetical protein
MFKVQMLILKFLFHLQVYNDVIKFYHDDVLVSNADTQVLNDETLVSNIDIRIRNADALVSSFEA